MSLMKGKKGLIMGVANERSIASIQISEAGAELAFTYLGDALKKDNTVKKLIQILLLVVMWKKRRKL